MVEVNLYPWRFKRKQYEQKKMRLLLAVTSIFSSLILAALYLYIENSIDKLNARIENLKNKMIEIESQYSKAQINHDKQLKKSDFNKMRNVLQLSDYLLRQWIVRHSNNICLVGLAYKNNQYIFSGVSPSAFDLTEFVSQQSVNHQLAEFNIEEMRLMPNNNVHFRMVAVSKEE